VGKAQHIKTERKGGRLGSRVQRTKPSTWSISTSRVRAHNGGRGGGAKLNWRLVSQVRPLVKGRKGKRGFAFQHTGGQKVGGVSGARLGVEMVGREAARNDPAH